MEKQNIIVKGAKEHNLKNIDITIPRNKLIVFTGLSGSGKSSLAFDTIYAEGQRRYVESLSSYARQFLGQMEKPNVEYIEGLSPAISIDQKTTSKNPRSTVGTVTEIYDYYRLLFARIGLPHCPKCGKPIESQSIDQMVDVIMGIEDKTKIQILAPIVRGKKGQHKKILEEIKKEGYVRARIDGEIIDLSEEINLEKNKKHNIEIVIDRIIVKAGIEGRITDSLEIALKLGEGLVIIDKIGKSEIMLSQKFACIDCNIAIDEISTRMFSFNSPFGMCPTCNGLGIHKRIDRDLVLPDLSMTIREGAVEPFHSANKDTYYFQMFKTLAEEHGFTVDQPLEKAPKKFLDELLFGTNERNLEFVFESHFNGTRTFKAPFEGVINNLERRYKETSSDYMRNKIEEYMSNNPCEVCNGKRLRPESLSVLIENTNIIELTEKSIEDSLLFFEKLQLSDRELIIAEQILKEINARLGFLRDVGLRYLTLDRASGTLSGGESQRIRLATQIGSALVGVLYVLDEPSIGLHQRDNDRLLKTLRHLTDLGNTLIVVEHDEDTMKEADQIVDIGPRAGIHGGEIVAQGTLEEVKKPKIFILKGYII